jgi:hypothetical protein
VCNLLGIPLWSEESIRQRCPFILESSYPFKKFATYLISKGRGGDGKKAAVLSDLQLSFPILF